MPRWAPQHQGARADTREMAVQRRDSERSPSPTTRTRSAQGVGSPRAAQLMEPADQAETPSPSDPAERALPCRCGGGDAGAREGTRPRCRPGAQLYAPLGCVPRLGGPRGGLKKIEIWACRGGARRGPVSCAAKAEADGRVKSSKRCEDGN